MNTPIKRLSLQAAAMLGISLVLLAIAFGARHLFADHARVLAREARGEGVHAVTLLSTAYTLDRPYKSMQGPRGNQGAIRLAEEGPGETIWLTGLDTQMVDADSLQRVSAEFFCHANLTFNPQTISPEVHNASFEPQTHADWRLVTLIPGRMSIQLPEGFGVPLHRDTLVDYFTMALNQNPGPDRRIRMKTVVTYRGDDAGPMRPLFRRSLYVYQQHQEHGTREKIPMGHGDGLHEGEFCAESCDHPQTGQTPSWFETAVDAGPLHPGATCCVANASKGGVVEQFGDENTIHWMVPPGKHTYRTEVTEQMDLPFDTTVHYVTGHLHPFGKRLWLRDLETGETMFEVTGDDFEDRLGVARMSEIVSIEGVPITNGRRYELVCEYENTSDSDTDAMAILYLYALDQL